MQEFSVGINLLGETIFNTSSMRSSFKYIRVVFLRFPLLGEYYICKGLAIIKDVLL